MGDLISPNESWGNVRGKINAMNASAEKQAKVVYRNRGVANITDSIGAQNHDTPLTGRQSYGRGWMSQAHALAQRAWHYGPELNFGVSGDTTATALARTGANSITALVALNPARVAVGLGTNDVTGGVAKETIWDNLRRIYDPLNEAGIAVDGILLLPRSYSMDATKRAKIAWLNRKIADERYVRSQALFSPLAMGDAITSRSSSTGDPLSLATGDGLHPIEYGAMLLGRYVADYYGKIFRQAPPPMAYSRAQYYDAAENPYGALNSYTVFAGNNGNLGATGISGQVVAGHTVARANGTNTLTAVCTPTTIADGTGQIVQDISLGASGTGGVGEIISFANTGNVAIPASLPAGKYLRAFLDVECINVSNVCNISLNTSSSVTGLLTKGLGGTGLTGDRVLANSRRLIETPRIPVTTPGTEAMSLAAYITADCSGAAPAGIVRIWSMILAVCDY